MEEIESTLGMLLHLAEFERRKFHLELGYGSLYEYCMDILHYTESPAVRRIKAARCLARRCDASGDRSGE